MKGSSFLIVHKWARLHKFGGHGRNIFHAQNFKRPPVLNPGHAPMNALCCKVRKGKWPMQLPKHQDARLILREAAQIIGMDIISLNGIFLPK